MRIYLRGLQRPRTSIAFETRKYNTVTIDRKHLDFLPSYLGEDGLAGEETGGKTDGAQGRLDGQRKTWKSAVESRTLSNTRRQ